MNKRLAHYWRGPGGCGEVLRIAFPLILSTGAHSVQMFIDRMFLMWHSSDAMAAGLQAGIASFVPVSLFMGTAGYVNTFVAQYTGADRPLRVGPAIWQGIYFALAAGVLMLTMIPLAGPIFDWMGHAPRIREQEIIYFKIMCLAATPTLVSSVISGFFTGRSKTLIVMYVTIFATAINIVLDYCLIFGNLGFPRLGIAGAAIATLTASVCAAGIYLALFFRRPNRRQFASVSGWRLDRDLFTRLMRYGLPNGVQFMLDILAFALFIVFVGRMDKYAFAATAMTFQINTLAFLPMMGFGIAVSTLVGQALGKNDARLATRSTWSACYMTFAYMTLIAAGYWFVPQIFLFPFAARANPAEFAAIEPIARSLLCFVAFYCLFDTGNIIFSAALKGAGDTRFVMAIAVVLSWVVMVIPCYLAVKLGWGLFVAWGAVTAYVCILALVFLLRFRAGKWKTMRVIEAPVPTVPARIPEVPTVEVDRT